MGIIAPSVRAKVIGIAVQQDESGSGSGEFLPQHIILPVQGNSAAVYSTTPFVATGPQDIIAKGLGYGSPADLCGYLGLWPRDGTGVKGPTVTVYPLVDDGAGQAAAGAIGATGNVAKNHNVRVRINKQILTDAVALVAGDTPAVALGKLKSTIDGTLRAPFTTGTVAAGSLPFTAKWKGLTGNQIYVEIVDADDPDLVPSDTAVTWAVTQATGGTTDPSLDAAVGAIGEVWGTVVVNTMVNTNTTALNSLSNLGETKWNQDRPRPLMAIAASTATDPTSATAVSDSRPTDRTNCCVHVPGSKSLPFVIAARAAAERVNIAHTHPADDRTVALTGIDPGPRATQWNSAQRELVFSRGGSTTRVVDHVTLVDLITFYKPTGQDDHGYRHAVDNFRLQNAVYKCDARFASEKWDGAPIVRDGQPTPNEPRAKTPSDAVDELHDVAQELADAAIISDPAKAKASAKASVTPNRKGLNWEMKIPLSSNSNVIAGTIKFSLRGGFDAAQ